MKINSKRVVSGLEKNLEQLIGMIRVEKDLSHFIEFLVENEKLI